MSHWRQKKSILVLIRITIRIQEFLTEFLPLRDSVSFKNLRYQLRWRRFAISECFQSLIFLFYSVRQSKLGKLANRQFF